MKKDHWQREFEKLDVKDQLKEVIWSLRKLPDKGGELTRICRLAVAQLRFLENKTEEYLERLYAAKAFARRGGRSTSEAKRRAAQANGRKGGRPATKPKRRVAK